MAEPKKVCVVGSGNWGSVIAKIVGFNVQGKSSFVEQVPMYVYEEEIDGVKLTEIINLKHENTKYLPGCKLPENVVAIPSIQDACADADILIFVMPHQFLTAMCSQLVGKIKPKAFGVSLIKGIDSVDGKLDFISNTIRKILNIECAVLMGANIAIDVAKEEFCEATIGCKNAAFGKVLKEVFETPYFRIVVVPDEEAVELCGALKNIVALGAGFVEGLRFGDNTKAAVIRLGFMEMIEFCKIFKAGNKIDTFLQSCGIADLVTTCYSGRNRKVAAAFAASKGKSIEQLEKDLLNGQKLQGPPTAVIVYDFLKQKGNEDGSDWLQKFPLFARVKLICSGEMPPKSFLDCLKDHPQHTKHV